MGYASFFDFQDPSLAGLESSTNDISVYIGMLDPWYERNVLGLMNLPTNVLCQVGPELYTAYTVKQQCSLFVRSRPRGVAVSYELTLSHLPHPWSLGAGQCGSRAMLKATDCHHHCHLLSYPN